MDDLEEMVEKGDGLNFIPCLKWVSRGKAKSQPEKVYLIFVRVSSNTMIAFNLIGQIV